MALYRGWPLARHAVEALRGLVSDIAIVAKPDTRLPALDGLPVWFDDEEGFHPRHGIVTALRRAQSPVLVLAVDLPLARPALERLVALRAPTALAEADGRVQPLCAKYDPHDLAVLEVVPDGESLVASALRCEPDFVDVPPWVLTNVNTRKDLR